MSHHNERSYVIWDDQAPKNQVAPGEDQKDSKSEELTEEQKIKKKEKMEKANAKARLMIKDIMRTYRC